jgi:hypothetical protein
MSRTKRRNQRTGSDFPKRSKKKSTDVIKQKIQNNYIESFDDDTLKSEIEEFLQSRR